MEQVKDEQTLQDSQPAAAEQVKESDSSQEVSLGKFKDVKSLIHAYNSLQAEFTKRCQRIKELEGEREVVDKAVAPTTNPSEEGQAVFKGITDEDKQSILRDYLKGVVESKQKAILMDGTGMGVKTPVSKPKTLAEAGALAKEYLNKD